MNIRNRAGRVAVLVVAVAAVAISLPPTAAAAGQQGQVYVALGDSAAAGPLIPLPDLASPGCLRSTSNYPKLVAARLGLPIRDVTCSGAVTADMTAPQNTELGAVPPQFDALGPDTSLVTVQIGGNDAGLVGLALSCVNLLPPPLGTSCAAENTAGGQDVYGERIAATAPRIAAVLDGIHARAPNARVFIVGYTTYLPPNGCYPLVPLWEQDANYIQAKIDQLNQVFVDAAGAHNATYVDIRTPGIGHDVCALPHQRWVEPLIPTSVAAPLHPNANGMAGMATVVVDAVSAAVT